jgi:hypothetical protein
MMLSAFVVSLKSFLQFSLRILSPRNICFNYMSIASHRFVLLQALRGKRRTIDRPILSNVKVSKNNQYARQKCFISPQKESSPVSISIQEASGYFLLFFM